MDNPDNTDKAVEFTENDEVLEDSEPLIVKGSGQDLLHSFGWSFLEQGGSKLVLMLVQLILARLLDPHAFGVLAILLVFTNIADVISQSGLGMGLIQRTECSSRTYSTAFWISMGIALVLYIILFVSSPLIAMFYEVEDFTPLLRIMSLIVFFHAANSIQRSFLQRIMDFKRLCMANIAGVIASGIIGIAMAMMGCGVWALVGQMLSQAVAICVALLWFVPWKPSFAFDRQDARELIDYGWKICATGLLGVFHTGISDLIVGKACTVSDLGFYSQGRKWPNSGVSIATNAIQNVLFPEFSAKKDDRKAFKREIEKALKVGSFIVIPFAMLAAAAASPLVSILLTDKWIASVPVFQMSCLTMVLTMMQLVNLRAYMALGRSDLYLRLQAYKVLIGIVFICSVSILTRNIYWTAFATMACSFFCVIFIDLGPAKEVLQLSRKRQMLDIAPTLILGSIAMGMAYLVLLVSLQPFIQIILQAIVFALVYVIGSKLLKLEEFSTCVNMIKRITGRY